MRLESYQLASTIDMLVTCGERLDIADNPNWHAVASAAARLEDLHAGKPVDLKGIAASLRKAHDQVAAVDREIAVKIGIALAIVDALRVGFLKFEPAPARPVWIGIDMARGQDQTVRANFHA